jgi:NAD(P)-dependent dehydrogenase (short-subunit alcohol dehydrogenase family)
MGRVDGKVALVTGGAAGIGRASARALAADGARVGIGDIDAPGAARTAREIRDAGGESFDLRTDVTSSADVEALVDEAVRRYGRLDVMFANAGIALGGSAADVTEDDWRRVLDVNLSGVWRAMRFAIPAMVKAGGGSIINTSSVQSAVGFVGWAGYAASKGGINALTTQAAVEYAPMGIRINAVVPGTIMTEMNERIMASSPNPQAVMDSWRSMHPVGRVGQPHEVAAAVVFLASDESSFVTGELLRVDGGMIVRA